MRDIPVVWAVVDILSYVRFKLPLFMLFMLVLFLLLLLLLLLFPLPLLLIAFDCIFLLIALGVELKLKFPNTAGEVWDPKCLLWCLF